MIVALFIITVVLTAFAIARPARLLAAATTAMLVAVTVSTPSHMIERTRSFFAVHSIFQTQNGQGRYLQHGNTLHGAERAADAAGNPLTARTEPASYFHFGGGGRAAVFLPPTCEMSSKYNRAGQKWGNPPFVIVIHQDICENSHAALRQFFLR